MNKEEILSKARKENKGVDAVEQAAKTEAAKISMAVGAAACMLLNLLDRIILQTDVIGDTCWIIYGIMVSTSLWVQGAYLKCFRCLCGNLSGGGYRSFRFAGTFQTKAALIIVQKEKPGIFRTIRASLLVFCIAGFLLFFFFSPHLAW